MRRTERSGGATSPAVTTPSGTSAQHPRRRRYGRGLLAAAVGAIALCGFTASAGAEEEGTVTFPGSPLTVSVGSQGQCQTSYANHGNNWYPPGGNLGDCGFFLAFPKLTGQPIAIEGLTFGFSGSAGPHLTNTYTPISMSKVEGAGTAGSPFVQTTVFSVNNPTETKEELAKVTETTTYVNGEPQFVSTFNVKNVTSKPASKIYFRAIYAGDMFLLGSDFGTGVFLGGPPRFVGGQNPESGVLGGLIEAAASPWSAFQEGCWNETPESRCSGAAPTDSGIWNIVRSSVEAPTAFNNTVDTANIDNGVGVEWDELRETGLAGGGEKSFTIINRSQVPSNLQISPVNQTRTQGQTATVTVTATDLAGVPYAGRVLHYTISGANPQTGTITLNSAGQAQISYVGKNAGIDTDQLFVDLAGTGVRTPGDPSGAAQATFLPLPPTPNSTYRILSVKANPDGTITITLVPVQAGTATVEVTVPTGTIARKLAAEAKKKKCKKGLVRIKRKCRPPTTVSGRVSAAGAAGVPLTITVKPSSKVTKALKKGKKVVLTAKLTYKSALGGTPSVTVMHFTIKPKKKKKHHH
jgi:hypothetical protein